MLIAGGCCCGASDDGAFGFSNERSLVYCASTFNWGGGAASGGVPLPLVIGISPERFERARTNFAPEFADEVRKWPIGASGYHRPACFHKKERCHRSGRRSLEESLHRRSVIPLGLRQAAASCAAGR